MQQSISRRDFVKDSVLATAGTVMAMGAGGASVSAATNTAPVVSGDALPKGKIGNMEVSRMLLGGNLLTHFTHSRDLKYVYRLTEHYNTDEKIMETLALAEQHGINTLSMHNPPRPMGVLRKYRANGGKIKWIICATAPIEPGLAKYTEAVQHLVDDGCDAIYVWGVRADPLVAQGKVDLIGQAVDVAKTLGVPSGVGCHDLEVVKQCEAAKVRNDFYIKTFHSHNYPSAPRPDQLTAPYAEHPGYWCRDPKETAEVMSKVEKPWIAFKVMAAGAIPPRDAFKYVFENGADFTLAGMFDFEIAEDVKILKQVLATLPPRSRPWHG